MNENRDDKPETTQSTDDSSQRDASRRSFLRNVGKKALYVTPILMTLTARETRAQASPSTPS